MRYTGAEPDAVIGCRNIIIHGLGYPYHLHAFLIQAYPIAQRVIAADRDQIVDPELVKIVEHFRR